MENIGALQDSLTVSNSNQQTLKARLQRAFHAAGPAREKARCPHFVRSCGIAKFVVEEDRRPARERLMSTGLTMLDR